MIEYLRLAVQEREGVSKLHHESIMLFARLAINGALLLNGSAAVAVLARQPKLSELGYLVVEQGAYGAFAAVLCAGFSYFAQICYQRFTDKIFRLQVEGAANGVPGRVTTDKGPRLGYFFHALAIIAFIMSLSIFFRALILFNGLSKSPQCL